MVNCISIILKFLSLFSRLYADFTCTAILLAITLDINFSITAKEFLICNIDLKKNIKLK